MTNKKKAIPLIFICALMFFSKLEVFSQSKDITIKVGLYLYEPYYYKDKNNNITGYYHEFLDILCRDANIKYEYVNVSMENAIEKLKNKEVDIILGVHDKEGRAEGTVEGTYFSENHIGFDKQYIYTKDMDVFYGDLNYLNGKKLAYIKGDINENWLSKSLKEKNIKLDLLGAKDLDDCIKMFENDEVDVISIPSGNNSLKNYNNIYTYSSGIVYILGNEDSKDVIEKLDTVINKKYKSQYCNKLLNTYNKYFRKEIIVKNLFILLFILLLILIITYKIIYPYTKKIMVRRRIRKNKEKNNFMLYYQPIVSPKDNKVVGFESLLRLKDKNKKVVPPSTFLKEIESSNMLCEMTLWVLERAINDYNIISNYDLYKDKEFYISINLSFEELENEYLVDEIIRIANKYNIKAGSICLEIVENICINDFERIKTTIERLKDNGFKIAIDDFGTEYANLNILEIVEFDIIKLDKYFADNILKSIINTEVIKFLSNITLITNKNFIIEGVEEKYQVDEINKLSHNNFYIQGYFYSKPLSIEDVQGFTIKAE